MIEYMNPRDETEVHTEIEWLAMFGARYWRKVRRTFLVVITTEEIGR